MTWLDPQWLRQNITNDYFEVPLAAVNFDKTKILKEQCSFQVTCNRYYKDFANTRRASYVLLISEQCETTFSLLTTLSNDRQYSMRHDTMEDCVLTAGNNSNWSEQEKQEILNKVMKKMKKRKKIVGTTKKSVLTSPIDQAENNDSLSVSSSSDECSGMEVYSE